ncbi:MAG: hypothetical protein SGARI_005517, partial [Bacillariaceae sp.]
MQARRRRHLKVALVLLCLKLLQCFLPSTPSSAALVDGFVLAPLPRHHSQHVFQRALIHRRAVENSDYSDNDVGDNDEAEYYEEDDDDFVLFEEELTSASPEEKLVKAKQQGKQPKPMNTWSGDDDFEEDSFEKDPKAWNPETLMSTSSSSSSISESDVDDDMLSEEQALALEYIQRGQNVFITGVAGTGKSLVLKKALEFLASEYRPKQYVAVAPTGSTAIALEGQTLHS